MEKGDAMKKEMEKARTHKKRPDGFREIVMKNARLRRACGIGGDGDMSGVRYQKAI